MRVQRDGRRFTVDVVSDGEGLVSHAGAALLAEAADRLGLTDALSRALASMRERRGRHDPGRVVRDLAVMLADGGDCLADLRAVRDQQAAVRAGRLGRDGVSGDRPDRRRPGAAGGVAGGARAGAPTRVERRGWRPSGS